MTEKQLTFDEINALVEKVNLADFQPGGRHHLTADAVKANPALALPQLCPLYKTVRPILVAISNLVIIPQKWRDLIKTFIAIIDALCP